MNEREEAIIAAAETLADKWDDHMLAADIGPKLTCGEVAPLIDLLMELGRDHAAEFWARCHGAGDDDPFDAHHDTYLTLTEESRA